MAREKYMETRVAILEEHISTLNSEMGDVKKEVSELKDVMINPKDGICIKIERAIAAANITSNNLKWIKWIALITLGLIATHLGLSLNLRI